MAVFTSGNDTLSGGAGNDTLNGGAGADVMYGDRSLTTYTFNACLVEQDENWAAVELSRVDLTLGLYEDSPFSYSPGDIFTFFGGEVLQMNIDQGTLYDTIGFQGYNDSFEAYDPVISEYTNISGERYILIELVFKLNGTGHTLLFEMYSEGDQFNQIQNLDDWLDNSQRKSQGLPHIDAYQAGVEIEYKDAAASSLAEKDTVFIGAGNDKLYGDSGNDTLYGGNGNDKLYGGNNNDKLYGGHNNDMLYGGNNNDRLYGGNNNDKLYGGDGNDKLYGGNGNDTLVGGAGNDAMDGGAGDDFYEYWGYEGFDVISETSGFDTIVFKDAHTDNAGWGSLFQEDDDLVYIADNGISGFRVTDHFSDPDNSIELFEYESSGYSVLVRNSVQEIVDPFGNYDELLVGTVGNDTINSAPGDNIRHDEIYGYDGDDTIDNSEGGKSWIEAGDGDDFVRGGASEDRIRGQDGDDKLSGKGGNDYLFGGSGNDKSYGQAGNDSLYMDAGNDTLDGGSGADWLYVTGSTNSVVNLAKTTGQNTGYGTDIIKSIENASGGKGVDKFYGTTGNNTLKGNNGNDLLYGQNGNDALYGGNNNDKLYGGNGNDKLYGGNGNDTLVGGAGNDAMDGGAGDDFYEYWGYEGFDVISETSGFDTIVFKDAHTDNAGWGSLFQEDDDLVYIADNGISGFRVTDHFSDPDNSIELFEYESSGYSVLVRNSVQEIVDPFGNYDELLVGTVGNDTINSAPGDNIRHDEIYGYDGDDTIDNSEGGKSWIEAGDGDDFVRGGASEDRIRGQDGDDKLSGKGGNDYLFGGSGNDKSYGQAGNDSLYMDAGNDTLDGGSGADWLYVTGSTNSVVNLATTTGQNTGYGTDIIKNIENASGGSGVDKFYGTGGSNTLKGNNGNDVLSGKNGNDKLYGGNNNDKLYGGNGNDLLKGGAGRDMLKGDAGKDTMFGGSGADTFVFKKTSDSKVDASKADVIKDFQQGVDVIDLSAIDASTKLNGNNKFTFDGTTSFGTSNQGDVYYETFNNDGTANDYTMVYIDTDNDRGTEMSIKLMGLHNLTADDFIL